MKKINIRRLYYHIRHRYFTMSNVVILVAMIVAASWVWGSIGVMQRNYALQKEVDAKAREKKLAELEVQTLTFRQNYYKSKEYQEFAIRERMGLAFNGENVLILPKNTDAAKALDAAPLAISAAIKTEEPSNMQQWISFLFGANRQK